jgi:hypothetical protein
MTRQKWKLIYDVYFISHDSLTRNPEDLNDAYALLSFLLSESGFLSRELGGVLNSKQGCSGLSRNVIRCGM